MRSDHLPAGGLGGERRATLVLSPRVVVELRVALLADVRSIAEQGLALVREIQTDAARDEIGMMELAEKRRRWRARAAAVKTRHELHRAIGFPGETLVEQTLHGDEVCALALEVLSRRRDALAAPMARPELADTGMASTSESGQGWPCQR